MSGIDMTTFRPLPGAQPGAGAQPPPAGGLDMSTFKPLNAAPGSPPLRPQPAQDAIAGELGTPTTPGAAEGTYNMNSPSGHVIPVRFSRVHQALDQGLLFADKQNLQNYARDHAADPLDEDRIDQWLDKHPYVAAPVNLGKGLGIGLAKTLTGLLPTPTTRAGTEMQMLAATPAKGGVQEAGEVGENLAEFFSGEELLSMLGKTGAALSMADKLKTVTGLAQLIDKVPMVGKLLKIGASAAKQGTIAGAQTLAKTGNVGAAGISAGLGAAAGPVADLVGAGGSAINAARKGSGEAIAEAASKAAGEYGQEARAAGRPALEDINASRRMPEQPVLMNQPSSEENVMMNQPGGQPAVPTGRRVTTPAVPTGAMGRPTETPQINVGALLNQIHDFTGAADRLAEVNDAGYTELDQLTGGRFRQLNGETAAAQKAVWKGEPGAADAYKAKQAQMDALIDSTPSVTPQMKQALKGSWRQSYQLRDFGDLWDRNLNGVPGASQVSQAQRGLNGNGLMRDLQRAVKVHGRGSIEEALGPGRLENLENLARANQTNSQRVTFNRGIWDVVRNMGHGAMLGGAVGHFAGSYPAGALIGGGLTGAPAAYGMVMNALKTNPKIAQNFLFALESGAKAERYGPFIATMIQRAVTEGSREQQRGQGRASDWQQQPDGSYKINPQQPVIPALEPPQ